MGIHVDKNCYHDIPIHDTILPEEYQELEHVVKCVNYPDSNKVSDFDPYNSNFDGTTSQITEVGTQMSDEDDNNVLSFIQENVQNDITDINESKTFYSQVKPNFMEAVNWITNQDEVTELKHLLDKFVSDIKSTYQQRHPVEETQVYVSSNMPIETSKKHHGCSGWKENKKRKK